MSKLNELIGKEIIDIEGNEKEVTFYLAHDEVLKVTSDELFGPSSYLNHSFFDLGLSKEVTYVSALEYDYFFRIEFPDQNFFIKQVGAKRIDETRMSANGKELAIFFTDHGDNFHSLYYYLENNEWKLLELASMATLKEHPFLKTNDLLKEPKYRLKILSGEYAYRGEE